MRLIGYASYAHACPVDGLVLSAAHVVQPRNGRNPPLPWPAYYAWSDLHQNSGYVHSRGLSPRDLGTFVVLSGTPHFYRHATEEPEPGDKVNWLEFDLSSKDKAFAPHSKQARVQRSVSGHLILDEPPMRGASGSCVLNEQGEVVAIITGGVNVGAGGAVGFVVSVSGQWWPGN